MLSDLLRVLARSIGLDGDAAITAADLVDEFDLGRLPRAPWVVHHEWTTSTQQ